MMGALKGQAKAVVAGVIGLAAFLAPVVDDGLAPSEALGALVAGLTAYAAVYWTPNKGAED